MRKLVIALVLVAGSLSPSFAASGGLLNEFQKVIELKDALNQNDKCQKDASNLLHSNFKKWQAIYGDTKGATQYCEGALKTSFEKIEAKYRK